MTYIEHNTFIIDCCKCKAKVAAVEKGKVINSGMIHEASEPFGEMVIIGTCPVCSCTLVGESTQIRFENYDCEDDVWTDIVRVYPKPSKTFSSYRIPLTVMQSLTEAERCLQASANLAAVMMFGRALEAVCRDVLADSTRDTDKPSKSADKTKPKKEIMLGAGIAKLREKNFIDDRLFEWSQQLHAFRNIAAHPEAITISRDDAEDLQTFVHCIIEYIYDLTDRYNEFKSRVDARGSRKKRTTKKPPPDSAVV